MNRLALSQLLKRCSLLMSVYTVAILTYELIVVHLAHQIDCCFTYSIHIKVVNVVFLI